MTEGKGFVLLAALSGFLAVGLGAFGAHGLEKLLTPEMMRIWEKAVDYQQFHTLALLGIGILLVPREGDRCLKWAGWMFLLGMFLFSGSLYLLALSGIRGLGAVTPMGGVAFLGGWGLLAWSCLGKENS